MNQDIGQFILDAPIAPKWKGEQLPLFLTFHDLKRILGWQEIYEQILPIDGNVVQLGVGYGRDLNIFGCLRALMEPNVPRRVIGFDTFEGVIGDDLTEVDGPKAEHGYYNFATGPEEYMQFLLTVLASHHRDHPSSDGVQFMLVPGKAQETLPVFLEHDQSAIALASFDLLVHGPTVECLKLVRERMPRGAIVAFNQFATPAWNVEARAFREVFGFRGADLRRSRYHRYWTYAVLD